VHGSEDELDVDIERRSERVVLELDRGNRGEVELESFTKAIRETRRMRVSAMKRTSNRLVSDPDLIGRKLT
jgi:hypothetical protein